MRDKAKERPRRRGRVLGALGRVRDAVFGFFFFSALGLLAVAAWALLVEPRRVVVEEVSYELVDRHEPHREGRYRVAFVSDFDLDGPPGSHEEKVRRQVNALDVDLVAIGGDVVSGAQGAPEPDTLDALREWFAGFEARDGVVIAWGEEESEWPELMRSSFPPFMRDLGERCELVDAGGARLRVCGESSMLAPIDLAPERARALAGQGADLTVARYLGAGAESWEGVEVSATLELDRVGDTIGLALLESAEQPGYRFRIHPDRFEWYLEKDDRSLEGITRDKSVFVVPRRPHRVLVRVEPEGMTTRLRAKIWSEEEPEPERFTIDVVDASPSRPARGSVAIVAGGAWTGSGRASISDLVVKDLEGRVLLEERFDDEQRFAAEWDTPGFARADFDATLVVAHNAARLLQIPFGAHPEIDLYLSGHTHGGQLRLPPFGPILREPMTPADWIVGSAQSLHGRVPIHVSRGIGTAVVPARLFCPPEVTHVELMLSPRR